MYPSLNRVSRPRFQGIFKFTFFADDKSALRHKFTTNISYFVSDSKRNISPSGSENHSRFSNYKKDIVYKLNKKPKR